MTLTKRYYAGETDPLIILFFDCEYYSQRQQQRQQVYKSGNISSNFLAEKGGPTTTMTTRMPTIVTAVSFVFGLAFGLFLFSRERE